MRPIYVVIHVATIGKKYHQISESQLRRIIENKPFYQQIKNIFIFTVGVHPLNIAREEQKLKTQHLSYEPSVGEQITIRTLSTMDIENDALILYIHSKGVSYDQYPTMFEKVTAWRHYMEHFVIDRWAECVQKIEEGYDCVGTELKLRSPAYSPIPRHYSGNFWWSKFSIIKQHIWRLGKDRNAVEFWIISDESIKAYNILVVERTYIKH